MTLVVARTTPRGVRVAGDMRVTDPSSIRSGFLRGALKVILLSPTLCIGYAGNVGAAIGAIRRAASGDCSIEEARLHLLDAHDRSRPKADFLLASLRPSKLVVIKEGRVEEAPAGWLGDGEAFSEYQRIYHEEHFLPPREFYDSPEDAADTEVAARMSVGMEAVVSGAGVVSEGETRTIVIPRGGAHKTVGEAVVIALPRAEDGLFAYSVRSHATASPFAEPLPAQGGVVPADFGSAERGAFSYSMLTPAQPGVGAIALYFYEGRLGVLYAPLLLDEPERYRDVSLDAFEELVRLRRGLSLQGFGYRTEP